MELDERLINVIKAACIQIIMAFDKAAGDKYRTIPDKATRRKLRSGRYVLVERIDDAP